ncbi:rna-directed dna polymerase from mobile element jockey-like [Willisornis vidua]|uniref:Rna-directed dna polymerase from mobile element jockey-like n=1 Tax=Willisornis vidua TaxID=1566151 RepID=A0ABQ9DU51_9PASS|nr:rna-directed dna polymerase from mobile element jockey-like [Willisornis vidua]
MALARRLSCRSRSRRSRSRRRGRIWDIQRGLDKLEKQDHENLMKFKSKGRVLNVVGAKPDGSIDWEKNPAKEDMGVLKDKELDMSQQ